MSVKLISESPSPSILTPIFDFPKAIAAVIDGKRITKQEWADPESYGMLKDGFLMLHRNDTGWHRWLVNDGDLSSTDWIIME